MGDVILGLDSATWGLTAHRLSLERKKAPHGSEQLSAPFAAEGAMCKSSSNAAALTNSCRETCRDPSSMSPQRNSANNSASEIGSQSKQTAKTAVSLPQSLFVTQTNRAKYQTRDLTKHLRAWCSQPFIWAASYGVEDLSKSEPWSIWVSKWGTLPPFKPKKNAKKGTTHKRPFVAFRVCRVFGALQVWEED